MLIEPLTEREREILWLLTEGLTNQEIAKRLFLSLGTVKAHNHNIFSKLGVSSRTQALRRAQELGLAAGDIAYAPDQAVPQDDSTLPSLTAPLIGRHRELDQVSALLADTRARLITLLGAGGMGKTRLALEVAHQHRGLFRDGVCFVPLAQVAEDHLVPAAILEALKVQFRTGMDAAQQLLEAVQKKRILLILDNFEHLFSAIPFVLDLLNAASHLRILVTSRERLNVSAEVILVIGGLDVQADNADTISDAGQLFLQVARQTDADFTPQADERAAIQRLCQLTGGMPLAIVLAGSWLDLLPLNEIADEIAHSLDILHSQMRDLPERQRSMRATILHSWQRLNPEQQRAFVRLTIFRGSFTRHAAEEITGAGLHTLQILMNRSFITAHKGRYTIHELLRQFGWEELQRATHVGEVANAHSQYYLMRLYHLEHDLKGRNQVAALHEIGADLDNLRLAWRWAAQTEQDVLLDSALETLHGFALISGRAGEVVVLLQFALEQRETSSSNTLLARLRLRLMNLRLLIDHEAVTLDDVEACLASAQHFGDPLEIGIATDLLASYAAYVQQDYARAITLHEQNILTLQAADDHFYTAIAYHKIGYSQLQIAGLDALIPYTQKAYEVAKRAGNQFNVSAALGNLGSAALYFGKYHEAEQYSREMLSVIGAFGYNSSRFQIINFTHILFLLGKFDEGSSLLYNAWNESQAFLDVNGLSFGHAMHSFLAAVEERYDDALHHALTSLQEIRNDVTGTLTANLAAALAYCGLNDTPAALRHLREAYSGSQQMRFYTPVTWGLPVLVICCTRDGQFAEAVAYNAMLRTHPLSAKAWVNHWPLFTATEAELRAHLDENDYRLAWQRGSTFQPQQVIDWLLETPAD